jgi:uncharacterized protein
MGISRAAARHFFLLFCSCFLTFSLPAQLAHAQPDKRSANYQDKKRQTNDIAVTIVTSGLSCTCARFAEDIRNVINDLRPDGVRVLPVLGIGGLQNLNDVLFLKGIDMGVVDEDNLRLLKKRDPKLYANIEQRVQYITKLYNSELHVLARDEIKSYDDLRGKKVNFNLKDSQTEVTADIVFSMLNIDVERSNYDNDEAIKKLRHGEISAMIILTGAPQAALAKLRREDGVHFLPLDQSSPPGHDLRPIFDNYMAGEITHEHYPALVAEGTSVPTIANRALLVAYSWPEDSSRYKRLTKFVHRFFERVYEFHDGARHPKWKDVNLAQEIPGWVRFKPAADWLARHRNANVVASGDGNSPTVKVAFEQFIENYVAATGRKTLSARERETLFTKFEQLLKQQSAH